MHPTRIFKSPNELQTAFNEYKSQLEEEAQKWLRVQYVGREGDRKADPQKVPMTMEGFERFCYENYGCVHQYFDNKDGLYSDFVTICLRIKTEIRENQIIGGLLGFYNPSITQRLNGLTDRIDTTTNGKEISQNLKVEIVEPENNAESS